MVELLKKDGPLRRLLKQWEPILPREKIFSGEFFEPELAVYPPIDKELEAMREAKRREWKERGYSEALIEKALLLSDRWASSMAATWAPPDRPDIREAILRSAYPKALDVADEWLRVMGA